MTRSTTSTERTVAVSLPEGWTATDPTDPTAWSRDTDAVRGVLRQRGHDRAARAGVVLVASCRQRLPDGTDFAVDLSVALRRTGAQAPRPTPTMLRAAMLGTGRGTFEVVRPVGSPTVVELPVGAGVRHRGVATFRARGGLVVQQLVDRFVVPVDGALLIADFRTPHVGDHEQLGPVFAAIAATLEVDGAPDPLHLPGRGSS